MNDFDSYKQTALGPNGRDEMKRNYYENNQTSISVNRFPQSQPSDEKKDQMRRKNALNVHELEEYNRYMKDFSQLFEYSSIHLGLIRMHKFIWNYAFIQIVESFLPVIERRHIMEEMRRLNVAVRFKTIQSDNLEMRVVDRCSITNSEYVSMVLFDPDGMVLNPRKHFHLDVFATKDFSKSKVIEALFIVVKEVEKFLRLILSDSNELIELNRTFSRPLVVSNSASLEDVLSNNFSEFTANHRRMKKTIYKNTHYVKNNENEDEKDVDPSKNDEKQNYGIINDSLMKLTEKEERRLRRISDMNDLNTLDRLKGKDRTKIILHRFPSWKLPRQTIIHLLSTDDNEMDLMNNQLSDYTKLDVNDDFELSGNFCAFTFAHLMEISRTHVKSSSQQKPLDDQSSERIIMESIPSELQLLNEFGKTIYHSIVGSSGDEGKEEEVRDDLKKFNRLLCRLLRLYRSYENRMYYLDEKRDDLLNEAKLLLERYKSILEGCGKFQRFYETNMTNKSSPVNNNSNIVAISKEFESSNLVNVPTTTLSSDPLSLINLNANRITTTLSQRKNQFNSTSKDPVPYRFKQEPEFKLPIRMEESNQIPSNLSQNFNINPTIDQKETDQFKNEFPYIKTENVLEVSQEQSSIYKPSSLPHYTYSTQSIPTLYSSISTTQHPSYLQQNSSINQQLPATNYPIKVSSSNYVQEQNHVQWPTFYRPPSTQILTYPSNTLQQSAESFNLPPSSVTTTSSMNYLTLPPPNQTFITSLNSQQSPSLLPSPLIQQRPMPYYIRQPPPQTSTTIYQQTNQPRSISHSQNVPRQPPPNIQYPNNLQQILNTQFPPPQRQPQSQYQSPNKYAPTESPNQLNRLVNNNNYYN
ncbi:hypothetical protein SNEBB_001350 [Seison nebaliae]|nr:hypothetical protein SNEBB_001350 [Seison nebaliae]